jgi:hypothetical protein
MILGSENGAGGACGVQGPCFPVFRHLPGAQGQSPPSGPVSSESLILPSASAESWPANAPLTCAVGWPAHYVCPAGYTWVAPNSSALMQERQMLHPSIARLPSNIACLSCLPGTFSPSEGSYRCMPCMLGTFSASVGGTACEECPSGTYADVYGASACARCSVGHWTYSGAQTVHACNPCSPGTGSCDSCVAGQYQSQSGQARCIACAPGTVASMRNATTCIPCQRRTFQAHSGKAFCDPCPPLQFASAGGTSCINCAPAKKGGCDLAVDGVCGRGCGLNFYWDTQAAMRMVTMDTAAAATAVDFCVHCPPTTLNAFLTCAAEASACWIPAPGRYYFRRSANASEEERGDTILFCPDGYDANTMRDGCTPCGAGYASANGSGCVRCDGGRFSASQGATACGLCGEGSFSRGAASVCTLCPAGNFSGGRGAEGCDGCSPGAYSNAAGAAHCTPCAAGSWSSTALRDSPCDHTCAGEEGLYSASGATACVYCAGGLTNADGSLCTGCGLGRYEGINAHTGARACVPCARGMANTGNRFAINSSACIPCPGAAGDDERWYASADGSVCLQAPPGFVRSLNGDGSGGAYNVTPCAIGTSRSSEQGWCVACPPGTWTDTVGQARCVDCKPGTFASEDDADSRGCKSCPQHTIAPNASARLCIQCAPGTDASKGGTACENCPANHFKGVGAGCQRCATNTVSLPGSEACTACPEWTVLPSSQDSALLRQLLRFSSFGQEEEEQGCVVCPPGYFMQSSFNEVTLDVTYFCTPCASGTHTPLHGARTAAACVACNGKGYVPDAYAAACVTCPAGQSSSQTGDLCAPCPPGTSNRDGLACIPCHAGEYAQRSGTTACTACPMGAFAAGAGGVLCTPCPQGTFAGEVGSVTCATCDADSFSSDTGAARCSARQRQCRAGEYIVVQSATPDRDNACARCDPCPEHAYTVSSASHTWCVFLDDSS